VEHFPHCFRVGDRQFTTIPLSMMASFVNATWDIPDLISIILLSGLIFSTGEGVCEVGFYL
jgi:hypothetical protein